MYDHVIWINKEWWVLCFAVLWVASICVLNWTNPKDQDYGPADSMAYTIVHATIAAGFSFFLIMAVAMAASMLGVEVGIRG